MPREERLEKARAKKIEYREQAIKEERANARKKITELKKSLPGLQRKYEQALHQLGKAKDSEAIDKAAKSGDRYQSGILNTHAQICKLQEVANGGS